jgi:hypothetical protein
MSTENFYPKNLPPPNFAALGTCLFCLVVKAPLRPRYMGVECDADSERCSAGDPSAARLARLPGVRCEAGKRAAGLVDNN